MTLTRHTPLRCTTRLKPMSAKRRQQLPFYREAKKIVWERDHGLCQAREVWPEVECWGDRCCHHIARQGTHPELRSVPSNMVVTCVAHHSAIHGNPSLARERGLLR